MKAKLYWDIKPTPRTELEFWNQWKNNFASKMISAVGKKIKVEFK